MEDAAIKHHYPIYNKLSKRNPKSYAIFSYTDRNGIIHLAYNSLKTTPNPILILYSINQCRNYLEQVCAQFQLCPKYCHLQESVTTCSHYKIKTCNGICNLEEDCKDYNERVFKAILQLKNNTIDLVLKQNERDANEHGFIIIKKGIYLGSWFY